MILIYKTNSTLLHLSLQQQKTRELWLVQVSQGQVVLNFLWWLMVNPTGFYIFYYERWYIQILPVMRALYSRMCSRK